MGYTMIEAKLVGSLNSHNDPRDDTDRAVWNELMDRIEWLIRDPLFMRLTITASLPREPVSGYGWRNKS